MKEFEIAYSFKRGFYKKELETFCELNDTTDVMIRPKRIGICGSDQFYMNKYEGEKLLLGHEWTGEVIKSNSDKFSPGDMVTSCAVFGCGKCKDCNDGNENYCLNNTVLGSETLGMLRTKVVLKERHLIKIPVLDWDSSALYEVAAIGDSVIQNLKLLNIPAGAEVLIMGGGSVGVMSAIAAKREGLRPTIVETEPSRVKIIRELGLTSLLLQEHLLNKRKYEFIADCTGDSNGKIGALRYYPALSMANSKILVVGHYEKPWTLDSHLFGKFSLNIKWMKGMSKNFYAESLVWWSGKIPKIKELFITEVIPISEVGRGFETAKDRSLGIKTVIKLNE